MLQTIETSIAKNEPNLIPAPVESPEQIVEAANKTQSATAGEKSNAENLKNESFRNKFKYGSQIEDKNLPNPEYSAPENHVKITRIKQMIA